MCPWVLGHGDSVLWGAPHICAGHIGGVLGISLELLTCCGYRDRLQTVGGMYLSLSLEKFLKTLKAFLAGHAMYIPPSLGSPALPISLSLCFGSVQ